MEAPAAATFLHLDPKLGPGKERLSLNVLPSLEIATRVLEHAPPPPLHPRLNTCEGNFYTRLRLLHLTLKFGERGAQD